MMCCCTSRPETECNFQWPGILFVCRLASPTAESCAKHRVQKALIEFKSFSAHRDLADIDLLTAGEKRY